ncbi:MULTISPECIES: hypothetical protein [Yersinia]|uniref:hypothetical protein n=1 Tax=Yersinia TaxID=629 RepID=UPI0005E4D9C7|nr:MULTISPECIES: hypothetical protein [Yersinia]CNL10053.1 Uncharacterised protein [Yersinia frederiksenii]VEB12099.1 Uncharacterised protein [Yersinia pseudotuberculosis]HEI6963674.1 hypothetical protein [Yersinia enterocolitica]
MTDEIKTGGPAFPWCGDLNDTPHIGLGMTLRDWMAAKALTGMISTSNGPALGGFDGYESHIASAAYAMADAMIKARG